MTDANPLILIADDDALVLSTLAEIFERSGFRVLAVSNGQEAIEAARAARPTVLLLDIVMPQLDGVAVAMQIMPLLPGAQIFLISGDHRAASILENAKTEGYEFNVFSKPTPPEALLSTIRLPHRR